LNPSTIFIFSPCAFSTPAFSGLKVNENQCLALGMFSFIVVWYHCSLFLYVSFFFRVGAKHKSHINDKIMMTLRERENQDRLKNCKLRTMARYMAKCEKHVRRFFNFFFYLPCSQISLRRLTRLWIDVVLLCV
jgi:hypothetical protein